MLASIRMADSAFTMGPVGQFSIKFDSTGTARLAAILSSFAISYSIMQSNASGHNLHIMTVYLPYIYNFVAIAMVVMALLMVSTVPYAAFKAKRNKGKSIWSMLFFVCLIIMLIRFPQDVVFIVMSAYVIFGLLAVLYRAFKGIKVEK